MTPPDLRARAEALRDRLMGDPGVLNEVAVVLRDLLAEVDLLREGHDGIERRGATGGTADDLRDRIEARLTTWAGYPPGKPEADPWVAEVERIRRKALVALERGAQFLAPGHQYVSLSAAMTVVNTALRDLVERQHPQRRTPTEVGEAGDE